MTATLAGKRKAVVSTDEKSAPPLLIAASADRVIQFSVSSSPQGVHIERLRRCAGRGVIAHSLLFHDERNFRDWRDADDLRFVYPLVYDQLSRLVGRSLGTER